MTGHGDAPEGPGLITCHACGYTWTHDSAAGVCPQCDRWTHRGWRPLVVPVPVVVRGRGQVGVTDWSYLDPTRGRRPRNQAA